LNQSDAEALRAILENIRHPEMLDSHPWVSRLFVKDAVARLPELGRQGPGAQLAGALADFFVKTLPSAPPRRGKRLDTRWGEFGLLAAQYFAPLRFGVPVPGSLRDAWGRIDRVILLYVFGRGAESLSQNEIAVYKLVGDESEVAPNSTLSDWHTKGMQKLAEALAAHEQYLAKEQPRPRPRRRLLQAALLILLLALASFLTWGGFKARRLYDLSLLVWQDASQIREQAAGSPSLETAKAIGPALGSLRQDFDILKKEVEPYLWLCPWLDWVPTYGGDIVSAPDLLALADSLLASADQSYQALSPILEAYGSDSTGLNPAELVGLLNQAQPQLTEARASLDLAADARARLDPSRLSPRLRDLLLDDVDRALPLMDDGLMLAAEIPRALGASNEGPKTYLLLAQNEDELRPTGGFITAASTLLLQDGKIVSLTFQNSGKLDNWERPYPVAPWQLQQYMNSPVLIFRDANWFTDYRTAALYAEYLYSYANNHSVDGVIAFDQHMLVEVLRVTGPVKLEGEAHLVDADNVVAFMRAEKTPTPEDLASGTWDKKAFINKITAALIKKMLAGGIPLEQLSALMVKVLNERDLILQLDNPTLTDFLARRGWDGALRPADGDFLMVVDSNVGFNKTNAVVQSSLSYDVDLTDLAAPRSQLVVSHQNNAASVVPCLPFPYLDLTVPDLEAFQQKDYPIDRCYWDYLRIYTLSGTDLLGAAVQTVPEEWTMLRQTVPPQVDILDEKIEGIRGFGTFKVVPGGGSLATNFRFALPASVLQSLPGSGQITYRLKIQKQPGTQGVAITIRLHLPNGATPQTLPPGAVAEGQNILLQSSLVTDLVLEFIFFIP
jgi:hypothetical protein